MSLFPRLPTSVEIAGRRVRIDPDFRIFVDLEVGAQTETLDAEQILGRFYLGKIPEDADAAVDQLLWFHRCGDGTIAEQKHSAEENRSYDFVQDQDAIYQSFRRTYGIDLLEGELHWWKFQKLLLGLPQDCPFMQRVYWRTADVSKMSKAERAYVLQQRQKFAVGASGKAQTREERDRAFIARLQRRTKEAAECRK